MVTYRVKGGTKGVHVHLLGRHADIYLHEFWGLVRKRFLRWDPLDVRVEDSTCCRIRTGLDQCDVAVSLDANDALELRVSMME